MLSSILSEIQGVLDDPKYTDPIVTKKINAAVLRIAGGILMPTGEFSPPLPDLYTYGTVNTSIILPYVSLPADYQRSVFSVYDSSNYRIEPLRGGSYYAFSRFLSRASNKSLAETGSIYQVAVKGSKIYYQGIPTASTTLGIHYYRKPVDMVLDTDEPDGLPDHLAEALIKHFVIKEIYGDTIEAGVSEPSRGMQYHTGKFFEALSDLVDFIGTDAEPQFYGSGGDFEDGGVCD
jgi:hypothetical protein